MTNEEMWTKALQVLVTENLLAEDAVGIGVAKIMAAEVQPNELEVELEDWVEDEPGTLTCWVKGCSDCLLIGFEGHGTWDDTSKIKSHQIFIDHSEGQVRVMVMGDINSDNPTHTFVLEGAREENRIEE